MYENIYEWFQCYIDLWNCEHEVQTADLLPFIDHACVNRFGKFGPAGMASTINFRRKVFPDFKFKVIKANLILANRLNAKLQASGTYHGSITRLRDVKIKVKVDVTYSLSEENKISGGKSNMAEKILDTLAGFELTQQELHTLRQEV